MVLLGEKVRFDEFRVALRELQQRGDANVFQQLQAVRAFFIKLKANDHRRAESLALGRTKSLSIIAWTCVSSGA